MKVMKYHRSAHPQVRGLLNIITTCRSIISKSANNTQSSKLNRINIDGFRDLIALLSTFKDVSLLVRTGARLSPHMASISRNKLESHLSVKNVDKEGETISIDDLRKLIWRADNFASSYMQQSVRKDCLNSFERCLSSTRLLFFIHSTEDWHLPTFTRNEWLTRVFFSRSARFFVQMIIRIPLWSSHRRRNTNPWTIDSVILMMLILFMRQIPMQTLYRTMMSWRR